MGVGPRAGEAMAERAGLADMERLGVKTFPLLIPFAAPPLFPGMGRRPCLTNLTLPEVNLYSRTPQDIDSTYWLSTFLAVSEAIELWSCARAASAPAVLEVGTAEDADFGGAFFAGIKNAPADPTIFPDV